MTDIFTPSWYVRFWSVLANKPTPSYTHRPGPAWMTDPEEEWVEMSEPEKGGNP